MIGELSIRSTRCSVAVERAHESKWLGRSALEPGTPAVARATHQQLCACSVVCEACEVGSPVWSKPNGGVAAKIAGAGSGDRRVIGVARNTRNKAGRQRLRPRFAAIE